MSLLQTKKGDDNLKTNLENFPKAAFPVSQMTSAELLDHILKLVNWKMKFKEELREIASDLWKAGNNNFINGRLQQIADILNEKILGEKESIRNV